MWRFLKAMFCFHPTWVRSSWPATLPWHHRYYCPTCGKGRDFDPKHPPVSRVDNT